MLAVLLYNSQPHVRHIQARQAPFSNTAIGQGRGAVLRVGETGLSRHGDPCTGSRDPRLTNGRFVTMDARGTTASELVIQNGRITSVGPSRGRLSPCTRTVNLGGRTAVPGSSTTTTTSCCWASGRAITRRSKAWGPSGRPGGAHRSRQGRARRRVRDVDGRVEPGAVHREAAADAGGAGCGAAQPSGTHLPGVHGTGGHQHARQGVLCLEGCGRQRHGRHRRQCALAGGAERAARRPDPGRPPARDRGCHGLCGVGGLDDQRGHGRIQPAGNPRPAGLVRGRHAGQRRPGAHVRRARRPCMRAAP